MLGFFFFFNFGWIGLVFYFDWIFDWVFDAWFFLL